MIKVCVCAVLMTTHVETPTYTHMNRKTHWNIHQTKLAMGSCSPTSDMFLLISRERSFLN